MDADIIIAGGRLLICLIADCSLTSTAGTTGCVVAGRLADARPDLKIILIETGRDIAEDQRVTSQSSSLVCLADRVEPLDGLFSVYEGADQSEYTWESFDSLCLSPVCQ